MDDNDNDYCYNNILFNLVMPTHPDSASALISFSLEHLFERCACFAGKLLAQANSELLLELFLRKGNFNIFDDACLVKDLGRFRAEDAGFCHYQFAVGALEASLSHIWLGRISRELDDDEGSFDEGLVSLLLRLEVALDEALEANYFSQ